MAAIGRTLNEEQEGTHDDFAPGAVREARGSALPQHRIGDTVLQASGQSIRGTRPLVTSVLAASRQ
ncbi:protein of unknown function [Burkholderia multivorans]